MSTLFDDLKQGLQEAIAYEKGQGTARIKTYTIAPVKGIFQCRNPRHQDESRNDAKCFCCIYGRIQEKQLRPGKEDERILPVRHSVYWKY